MKPGPSDGRSRNTPYVWRFRLFFQPRRSRQTNPPRDLPTMNRPHTDPAQDTRTAGNSAETPYPRLARSRDAETSRVKRDTWFSNHRSRDRIVTYSCFKVPPLSHDLLGPGIWYTDNVTSAHHSPPRHSGKQAPPSLRPPTSQILMSRVPK